MQHLYSLFSLIKQLGNVSDEALNYFDNLIDDTGLLNPSNYLLNYVDNLLKVDLADYFHDSIHCKFHLHLQ